MLFVTGGAAGGAGVAAEGGGFPFEFGGFSIAGFSSPGDNGFGPCANAKNEKKRQKEATSDLDVINKIITYFGEDANGRKNRKTMVITS